MTVITATVAIVPKNISRRLPVIEVQLIVIVVSIPHLQKMSTAREMRVSPTQAEDTRLFTQEMLDRAFLTQRAPKRVATTIAPTAAAAKKAAWMPV